MNKERQQFQDFVNAHHKEHMEQMYQMTQVLRPAEHGEPERDFFETGFILGVQWIGDLLGLELCYPDKEFRGKLDRIFSEVDKEHVTDEEQAPKVKPSIELLIEIAERLGWKATRDGECLELEKYSSAGQDFICNIRCVDVDSLCKDLKSYTDNYDPCAEAIKWVGDNGHGKNGAPDDLRDIISDMEECRDMMKELLKEWEDAL